MEGSSGVKRRKTEESSWVSSSSSLSFSRSGRDGDGSVTVDEKLPVVTVTFLKERNGMLSRELLNQREEISTARSKVEELERLNTERACALNQVLRAWDSFNAKALAAVTSAPHAAAKSLRLWIPRFSGVSDIDNDIDPSLEAAHVLGGPADEEMGESKGATEDEEATAPDLVGGVVRVAEEGECQVAEMDEEGARRRGTKKRIGRRGRPLSSSPRAERSEGESGKTSGDIGGTSMVDWDKVEQLSGVWSSRGRKMVERVKEEMRICLKGISVLAGNDVLHETEGSRDGEEGRPQGAAGTTALQRDNKKNEKDNGAQGVADGGDRGSRENLSRESAAASSSSSTSSEVKLLLRYEVTIGRLVAALQESRRQTQEYEVEASRLKKKVASLQIRASGSTHAVAEAKKGKCAAPEAPPAKVENSDSPAGKGAESRGGSVSDKLMQLQLTENQEKVAMLEEELSCERIGRATLREQLQELRSNLASVAPEVTELLRRSSGGANDRSGGLGFADDRGGASLIKQLTHSVQQLTSEVERITAERDALLAVTSRECQARAQKATEASKVEAARLSALTQRVTEVTKASAEAERERLDAVSLAQVAQLDIQNLEETVSRLESQLSGHQAALKSQRKFIAILQGRVPLVESSDTAETKGPIMSPAVAVVGNESSAASSDMPGGTPSGAEAIAPRQNDGAEAKSDAEKVAELETKYAMMSAEVEEVSVAFEEKLAECERLSDLVKTKAASHLLVAEERFKNSELSNTWQSAKSLLDQKVDALRIQVTRLVASREELESSVRHVTANANLAKSENSTYLEALNESRRDQTVLLQRTDAAESRSLESEARLADAQKQLTEIREKLHEVDELRIRLKGEKIGLERKLRTSQLQIRDSPRTEPEDLDTAKRENEALKSLLQCTLCRERFIDAFLAKCGHTFCTDCVQANLNSRNRRCPKCKVACRGQDIRRLFVK